VFLVAPDTGVAHRGGVAIALHVLEASACPFFLVRQNGGHDQLPSGGSEVSMDRLTTMFVVLADFRCRGDDFAQRTARRRRAGGDIDIEQRKRARGLEV